MAIQDDVYARALAFSRLHTEEGPFVMANAWDGGSAKLLCSAGFRALGTTSGGLAATLGAADLSEAVTLEAALRNAGEIVAATALPVSVDLEDGFGDEPEDVAEAIARAAAAGVVGACVEDSAKTPGEPIRPFGEAVERVAAAVEAARRLDFPFVVTARAENFLYGRPDLADTVARLRALAAVGADVLYAPALPGAEPIASVCAAVDRPVNVLLGAGHRLSVSELFARGVWRISLGSSLARSAFAAVWRAAAEVLGPGSCDYAAEALSTARMQEIMTGEARQSRSG